MLVFYRERRVACTLQSMCVAFCIFAGRVRAPATAEKEYRAGEGAHHGEFN